jgi:hypothetical protein
MILSPKKGTTFPGKEIGPDRQESGKAGDKTYGDQARPLQGFFN